MNKLELSDYYDLLNLHKALMEAKFHNNPDNKYIAGSPIIARIMNDIVDILIEIDAFAKADDWKEWRKLENQIDHKRDIYSITIDKISKDNMWHKYSKDEKIIAVKNYFSPFVATFAEIEMCIKDVDNIIVKKTSD